MGIELYWDDEAQTILLAEFEEAWTWDELYGTLEKIRKVVHKSTVDLSAIIDLRKGTNLPTSLLDPATLDHARRIVQMAANGTGPVVVVGAHPVIQTVAAQLQLLDPRVMSNVRFTPTLKAARRLLYPPETFA